MDSKRFDLLTKSVVGATSRRHAIRGLAAGLVAGVTSRLGSEPAAAQQNCVNLGQSCKRRKGERRPKCCGNAVCRQNRCECKGSRKRCGTECITENQCCHNKDCPTGQKCRRNRCVGTQTCTQNGQCPTGVCACKPDSWPEGPDAGECQKRTFANNFQKNLQGWYDFKDAEVANPPPWLNQIFPPDTSIVLDGNRAVVQPGNAYEPDFDLTALSSLGGFSSVFPANGYDVSVDIFLDLTEDTAFTRFDYTSAINAQNCAHLQDFSFRVGTNADGTAFCIAPGTGAHSGDIDNCIAADHVNLTTLGAESGFYTFRHEFRDDGAGNLDVRLVVLDPDGEEVFNHLFETAHVIATDVGGNRYAWFAFNNFPEGVRIDNIRRENL